MGINFGKNTGKPSFTNSKKVVPLGGGGEEFRTVINTAENSNANNVPVI